MLLKILYKVLAPFCKYDLMTYFNKHLKESKYGLINKEMFPAVYSKHGTLYYYHPDLITVDQSYTQYSIDGLSSKDIVIDLGANIGSFSFRCAHAGCKKIYAFEPITYLALWDNIRLNKLDGIITPSWKALGNGEQTTVEWMGEKTPAETRTMTQIITMCGGCNFLKCDTEGAEWLIRPDELKYVKRIEMEFHMFSPYADESKIKAYDQYFDMELKASKGNTLWYSGTNKYV
jgi:hypothetical protein